MHFSIPRQPSSTSTVCFVLLVILLLQSGVSYTITFGQLAALAPEDLDLRIPWLLVRAVAVGAVVCLSVLHRTRHLMAAIIVANGLFTLGLLSSMAALFGVLFGLSASSVRDLLRDVVLLAPSNVLIFSIWYWIIDPPGIGKVQSEDKPWDFLFPQRSDDLPHYGSWQPAYVDYLFLAFTTAIAFSPAETCPLSRRAKLMMMLQAGISAYIIVVILGAAVNSV